MHQLLNFRIEAGDKIIKNHLDTAAKNEKYTSHQTEKELIKISEQILVNDIVSAANNSIGFSVLADETADISGTKQLSIGIRFVNPTKEQMIREEFLGFVPLNDISAASISDAILSKCLSLGLSLDCLLGQGYDGCSTMAGKDNGVQSRIRMKYPKATFVHCSSYRLNLVVNNLSAFPQIRNTIGAIKSIIAFIRESPERRSMIPNVPLLCETRWTAKYKSIRVFCDNFDKLFTQLNVLSNEANGNTRPLAHQLLLASSSTTSLFGLIIISFYSALMEPCTQALQAIQLDLPQVQRHIYELLLVSNLHRNKADMLWKVEQSTNTTKAMFKAVIPKQLWSNGYKCRGMLLPGYVYPISRFINRFASNVVLRR
ncbi:zinc finger MYM-type protein 1-like [Hydra vulgaris]|uniref:Zinc finger MYM-type protein 1-like n=1 Tax=Hydra vulgaris TaxID=6087 RepID=A0ABM4C8U8_HYDVU